MKKFIDHAKSVSKRVMAIQATVILSVVYVLCVPFLRLAYGGKSTMAGWTPWTLASDTIEDVQGQ